MPRTVYITTAILMHTLEQHTLPLHNIFPIRGNGTFEFSRMCWFKGTQNFPSKYIKPSRPATLTLPGIIAVSKILQKIIVLEDIFI